MYIRNLLTIQNTCFSASGIERERAYINRNQCIARCLFKYGTQWCEGEISIYIQLAETQTIATLLQIAQIHTELYQLNVHIGEAERGKEGPREWHLCIYYPSYCYYKYRDEYIERTSGGAHEQARESNFAAISRCGNEHLSIVVM